MGEHVNGFWENVAGIAVTVLLVCVGDRIWPGDRFPGLAGRLDLNSEDHSA